MLGHTKSVTPHHAIYFSILTAIALTCAPTIRATLTVGALCCENLDAPLGIDTEKPRLSWQLHATERGENQASYQILAATTAELLAHDQADLWNTGRVTSSDTFNIPYTGRPLATSQQIFWKVRAWNASNNLATQAQPSPWSATATFTMGVLDTPRGPGWQPGAQWITAPALLKWVRKASGFATRDGKNENTQKWVQLDLGAPRSIDTIIVRGLQTAPAPGYGFPARLKIESSNDPAFKDPKRTITFFTSFQDWTGTQPAITTANAPANSPTTRYIRVTATKLRAIDDAKPLFALSQIVALSGTTNIALNATLSASDTSDDTTHWSPGALVDGLDDGITQNPHAADKLHLRREITVRAGLVRAIAHITGLGRYTLAANATPAQTSSPAWTNYAKTCQYQTCDLTTQLHPGDNTIELTLSGGMYNIYPATNSSAKPATPFRPPSTFGQIRLEYTDGTADIINTDSTWLASLAPVEWTPARETAAPGGRLRAAARNEFSLVSTGEFSCSSDFLNRLHTRIRDTQHAMLTHARDGDPQTLESDWLKRCHLDGAAMHYEWNLTRLDEKFLNDMAEAQTDSGLIPNNAPEIITRSGAFRDSPEYGAAFVTTAWQHYLWTGDPGLMRRHFDAMQAYADYLGSRAKKNLLTQSLGDLCKNENIFPPPDDATCPATPAALVATASYYETVSTLARIAAALERDDDAANFAKNATRISEAFAKAFPQNSSETLAKKSSKAPTAATSASPSQTSLAMTLALGLAPAEQHNAMQEMLAKRIESNDGAITTGDVGFSYLLRTLAAAGRSDLIFQLLKKNENAPGITCISEWLYHDLAGLQPDPDNPGFGKIIIKPAVIDGVIWARASQETPRGIAKVAWKIETGHLTLEAVIPTGATARVFIPTKNTSTVMESGMLAARAKGVRALLGGASGREAVFEIDSGCYTFVAQY